jgi:putative transposase
MRFQKVWEIVPMSKPFRTADLRSGINQPRSVFVTSRTAGSRSLFQTDRMGNLFVEVLLSNVKAGKFTVESFVVMPYHVLLLLTLPGTMTIERAMQLIKGGFSYRAAKELGFKDEIWQRGFSHEFSSDRESLIRHRSYFENNPVKAGLVSSPEEYRFGSVYLMKRKQTGAKAHDPFETLYGTTQVVP